MRDYADGALKTAVAPGVTANITWRPTDLTKFEFISGLSLSETISVGSSATRNWTAGIGVTHALRDNIDLTGGIALALSDANSGNSLTTTGRMGVARQFSPQLTWTAGYQGTWVNSPGSASDYTEHEILTSIILKR